MKKITLLAVLLITAVSYGQEFTGEHPNNLIIDGGFENFNDDGAWILGGGNNSGLKEDGSATAGVVIPAKEGDYMASVYANAGSIYQGYTVEAGENYTVKLWHKWLYHASTSSKDANIGNRIQGVNGAEGIIHNEPLLASADNVWTYYEYNFTVPAGTTEVTLSFWKGAGRQPTAIDNVQVAKTSTLSTEKFETFKFAYYPNPTKNIVNLSAANSISNVEFFNVLGQKVLSTTVNATQKQVNISSLEKGLYLMNVTIDGSKGTYKIIKE